jgi:putative membrane protein
VTWFALRAIIAALGLWAATRLLPGLRIDDSTTLLLAGLLLGVVNAIVRPLALVLTLPVTLLTLGLFIFVVNAAMLALVARLLPGFQIADFSTALLGAMIVGLAGWLGSWLLGPTGWLQRDR